MGLVNLGLHKSHLYESTVDFFYIGSFPKTIDNPELIDDYLEYIYPFWHNFEVFFLASSLLSDVKDSAENNFGITFHQEIPEHLQDFSDLQNFIPEGGELIAQVDGFRALDCYTAREKAEMKLGQLRDLFTLYHHKHQIQWRTMTLIKQCCLDTPRIVDLPKNPIEKGYDQKPEKASHQLNRMLRNFRLEKRDFQKFNRAVDFHGLAVNNSDPENQLLNLWIALETIVPTHTGGGKINQIIHGLLPFLSINYFWRTVGRLTQDMLRWNKKEVHRVLRKTPETKGFPLRKKVLLLLTSDNAADARSELYSSLRDFELLRYRIFSLNRTLNSPNSAFKELKLHEQKVAWQIRRLYRTRNLIVHSGSTPPYIQTLIENGHDYLDQVIITITRMVGSSYKVRTLEQAFELASIARKKLGSALKDSEKYDLDTVSLMINEHDFL